MHTDPSWAIDDERVVDAFAEFARVERRRSPLYAALADIAVAEADVRALLAAADPSQRRPVLLFAAVHDIAHRHPFERFSGALATVSGTSDPAVARASFAEFCSVHRVELERLLGSRRTQTNEIGRAAPLAAGLAWATADVVGPVSLIELGASAGLLLCLDRYRIEIGDELSFGDTSSSVIVSASVRNRPPPPGRLPPVAARIGVDLDPVDLDDAERAAWLLACVWADDLERYRRLHSAIDAALTDPPPVIRGDAADELPGLLAAVDGAHHPVVVNSWALAYMTPERRARIVEVLRAEAERRDVTWLSLESLAETPDLPRPATPLHTTGATDLIVWRARGGRVEVDRCAELHPHGRWIEWTL